MINLKPEELRFWEQVFLAQLTTGGSDWVKKAANADYAIELRRKRLEQPTDWNNPYRREPDAS